MVSIFVSLPCLAFYSGGCYTVNTMEHEAAIEDSLIIDAETVLACRKALRGESNSF